MIENANMDINETLSTIVTSQVGIMQMLTDLANEQKLINTKVEKQFDLYNKDKEELTKRLKAFDERVAKLETKTTLVDVNIDKLKTEHLTPLKETFVTLIDDLEKDVTKYKEINNKNIDDFNKKVNDLDVSKTLELLIKTFDSMGDNFNVYNENLKVQHEGMDKLINSQETIASRLKSLDNRMQYFNKIQVNTYLNDKLTEEVPTSKEALDTYFNRLNDINNKVLSNTTSQVKKVENDNLKTNLDKLSSLTESVLKRPNVK